MRRSKALPAALVASLALPPGGSARAQETSAATAVSPPDHEVALQRFREGRRLYEERRYREAARAFEASLAATWSIEALYNMALALDLADDMLAAQAAYRLYLERATGEDPHRATALERSEQLRRRLGEVFLQIDSSEALRQIRINGEDVSIDAFPWVTKPGPLEVEFVGAEPGQVKRVVADLRAGGAVTIVFPGFVKAEPPPRATAPSNPSEPPPDLRRQKALRAAFWASTGATLASGVALGVFGGLSLYHQARRNDLATSCPKPCTDPSIPEGAERAAEANGTRANVMIPIVAVFGVTALALAITRLRERPRGQARRASALGTALVVWF